MNSSIRSSFLKPIEEEEKVELFKRMDLRERREAVKKVAAPPTNKVERKKSEDINESAEAFIRKFKQQLVLQRLESIENYEQMLKRGT